MESLLVCLNTFTKWKDFSCGCVRMVVGFKNTYAMVSKTTNVASSKPA